MFNNGNVRIAVFKRIFCLILDYKMIGNDFTINSDTRSQYLDNDDYKAGNSDNYETKNDKYSSKTKTLRPLQITKSNTLDNINKQDYKPRFISNNRPVLAKKASFANDTNLSLSGRKTSQEKLASLTKLSESNGLNNFTLKDFADKNARNLLREHEKSEEYVIEKMIHKIKDQSSQSLKNTSSEKSRNSADLSSVLKWSKELTNPELESRSLNRGLTTEERKFRADSSGSSFKSASINQLFNIIERESTSFSIKLAYDLPRANNPTPHLYQKIDQERIHSRRESFNKLSTNETRSFNDFENKQTSSMFKIEDSPEEEEARDGSITPVNNYFTLENPANANVYSELNFNEQSPDDKPKPKPRVNYQALKTSRSTAIIKPNSSTKFEKNKKAITNQTSLEFERDDGELTWDALHLSLKFDKNTPFSSLSNCRTCDSTVPPSGAQTVLMNEINDQDELKSLIISYNSNNSTNRVQEPVKRTPKLISFKTNRSNMKKLLVKEFKYCILTDLKIGEGEFSEAFQGYRYDLGPPIKIAAKKLKNIKEKDNQNTLNLLSGKKNF